MVTSSTLPTMSRTYTHKPTNYSSFEAQSNGLPSQDFEENIMTPSFSTNKYVQDPLAEFSSIFSMSPNTPDLHLSNSSFNFPLESKVTALFDIPESPAEYFTSPWTTHAPSPLPTHSESSASEQSSPLTTEKGIKESTSSCCHKCKPK